MQNNVFNFDLIKKAVLHNPNFTPEEINQLCNMLEKYTDITDYNIETIRLTLEQPGININNRIKTKLNQLLAHELFNNQFFTDFNKISFTNSDRNTIETIHDFFGREYNNIGSSDNNGYAKNKSYELLIRLGLYF